MDIKGEITKAIGAHGMWKQRLRKAIDTGTSEFTVVGVRPDNNCEFGKWLHSLPTDIKISDHWKKVQTLHASFHVEASQVLNLALSGKKTEAEMALNTGKFSQISGELTGAMMKWQKG